MRTALFCAFLAGSLAFHTQAGQKEDSAAAKELDRSNLASTQETLAKWMEIQKIISAERQDWELAKEIAGERLELTESEIKTLEGKISEISGKIQVDEQEKAEATATRDSSVASTAALREGIGQLEAKVRQLHAFIPVPLQDKIAPLFQRMPPDPDNTKVSLAERFQNVIGILNEMNKLNSEVSIVSEIRMIDGKPTEVKAFYVGLACAYFLNSKGDASGVGRPNARGEWEWKADNTLIDPLNEAIAVLDAKAKPKFLPLSAELE